MSKIKTGQPGHRLLSPDERSALLQPQYMTPEQIADLVARARANTQPFRIEAGRRTCQRWEQYRATKIGQAEPR